MIENGRYVLTVLKFSLNAYAKVLNLQNPAVPKAMDSCKGITRDQVMSLMSSWNLSGMDAIRFASEKILHTEYSWAHSIAIS